MTLAFYPFGALFAALFLGVIFTAFAVALHLLDRLLLDRLPRSGASILPGLVSGMRDWSAGRSEPRIPVPTSPRTVEAEEKDEDGPVVIDLR